MACCIEQVVSVLVLSDAVLGEPRHVVGGGPDCVYGSDVVQVANLYWFAKFDEQPRWGLSVDVVVIHSFQLETLDPL